MPGIDLNLISDRICIEPKELCIYQPLFVRNCHKGDSTIKPLRSLVYKNSTTFMMRNEFGLFSVQNIRTALIVVLKSGDGRPDRQSCLFFWDIPHAYGVQSLISLLKNTSHVFSSYDNIDIARFSLSSKFCKYDESQANMIIEKIV